MVQGEDRKIKMRILPSRIGRLGIAILVTGQVLISGCAELKPFEIEQCIGNVPAHLSHSSYLYVPTRIYFTMPPGDRVLTIAGRVLFFPIVFPFVLLGDTLTLPFDIYNEISYQSRCNRLKKEKETSKENRAPASGN